MPRIPTYALGTKEKPPAEVIKGMILPEFKKDAFNCPHCGAYAHQAWLPEDNTISATSHINGEYLVNARIHTKKSFTACQCHHCKKVCLWMDRELVYPDISSVELPNQDLPPDIMGLYKEAESVLNKSPRAAAALLRVALEKLCQEHGDRGKSLKENIDLIAQNGNIPPHLMDGMTAVRVVGNEAVHPGKINFESKETPKMVEALFEMINFIAYDMITRRKRAEAICKKAAPKPSEEEVAEQA